MWLLKLKAWQVFLFAGVGRTVSVSVELLKDFGYSIPYDQLITLGAETWEAIGGLVTLAWIYTMGTMLNKRLDPEKQERLKLFKLSFVASITIFLFLVWLALDPATTMKSIRYLIFIGVVIHMYTYYIVAKLLESVERKWGEVGDNFFALLFVPIGVWLIQPRINKVFQSQN